MIFYIFFLLICISYFNFENIKTYFMNVNYNDIKIYEKTKPYLINNILPPILGLIDTFLISKITSEKYLGITSIGDQIISIIYIFLSFLPSVITPKISELKSKREEKYMNKIIKNSLILTSLLGIIGNLVLSIFTKPLIIYLTGNKTIFFSEIVTYISYRNIGFTFSLLNSLMFTILQSLDENEKTFRINFISQILSMIITSLSLYFYNLKGYVLSGVLLDISLCFVYFKTLSENKKMIFNFEGFFSDSYIFIREGMGMQIKNIINNVLYIYSNRKIISFDKESKNLSANIFLSRFLNLCFISLTSLNSTASNLIPSEKNINNDQEIKKRIIYWSIFISTIQSLVLYSSRFLFNYFISDNEILSICKQLILMVSLYQIILGNYHVLEGIIQGYQKFDCISLSNIITSIPKFVAIYYSKNLFSIWLINIFIVGIKGFYYLYILVFEKEKTQIFNRIKKNEIV